MNLVSWPDPVSHLHLFGLFQFGTGVLQADTTVEQNN